MIQMYHHLIRRPDRSTRWETLTPEAQKAARFVLENPNEVGVSSVREIAEAAQCQAQHGRAHGAQVGFEGYEDFREPFREAIRQGRASFPGPGALAAGSVASGDLGGLYADMVRRRSRNIEETFAGIDAEALKAAAETIWASRRSSRWASASIPPMPATSPISPPPAWSQFHAIPRPGSTAPTIWPGPTGATC
jgi:hypothetical protein